MCNVLERSSVMLIPRNLKWFHHSSTDVDRAVCLIIIIIRIIKYIYLYSTLNSVTKCFKRRNKTKQGRLLIEVRTNYSCQINVVKVVVVQNCTLVLFLNKCLILHHCISFEIQRSTCMIIRGIILRVTTLIKFKELC